MKARHHFRSICILVLIYSSEAPAWVVCLSGFRRLEVHLARALSGTNFTVPEVTIVKQGDVLVENEAMPRFLRDHGVTFEGYTPLRTMSKGLVTSLAYDTAMGYARISDPRSDVPGVHGLLFRVDAVTPKEGATRALEHPDTPAILEHLKSLGVELFVDSSMTHTSAAGFYWPRIKKLCIGKDVPFAILLHEYEHVLADVYGVEDFARDAADALRRGKRLEPLFDHLSHRGYGRARLAKVVEYLKAGHSWESINELMSVSAEIAHYGKHGDTVMMAERMEYAKGHVLNALVAEALRGELAPPRKKELIGVLRDLKVAGLEKFGDTDLPKLITRYSSTSEARLHQRSEGPARMKIAAAAAGATAVVAIVFHKALGKLVLYLANGVAIQIDPDDTIRKNNQPIRQRR